MLSSFVSAKKISFKLKKSSCNFLFFGFLVQDDTSCDPYSHPYCVLSDCFLNTTGCQHVAVSPLEVTKAYALSINLLQVLSGKALLPHRLRLTPSDSEPNHLAVSSVDLSKDSLIYLVARLMHRACFSHSCCTQIIQTNPEVDQYQQTQSSFYLAVFDLRVVQVDRNNMFDSSRRQ